MRSHKEAVILGHFQSLSHHLRILNGASVIGDTYAACRLESFVVAETVAAHAVCDAAHGIYLNACSLRLVNDIADSLGTVAGRLCIGHCKDSRNAACQCSRTAREDILLVGLSGVAEVNVHIEQ